MSFLMNIYRYVASLIHTTFDGTNEYIEVNYNSDLIFNYGKSNSFSCWVNFDTLGTLMGIYNNLHVSTGAWIGFIIYKSATDDISFQVRKGPTSSNYSGITSSNTLSASTWHHIAVTYSGGLASTMKIYIDGVLETPIVSSDTLSGAYTNTGIIDIGRAYDNNYLDGKIDKPIIYNTELTAGNVTTIYNYGRKAGLIGIGNELSQWELDALNPTDVIGSNDGTSINMDSSNIVVG